MDSNQTLGQEKKKIEICDFCKLEKAKYHLFYIENKLVLHSKLIRCKLWRNEEKFLCNFCTVIHILSGVDMDEKSGWPIKTSSLDKQKS